MAKAQHASTVAGFAQTEEALTVSLWLLSSSPSCCATGVAAAVDASQLYGWKADADAALSPMSLQAVDILNHVSYIAAACHKR